MRERERTQYACWRRGESYSLERMGEKYEETDHNNLSMYVCIEPFKQCTVLPQDVVCTSLCLTTTNKEIGIAYHTFPHNDITTVYHITSK